MIFTDPLFLFVFLPVCLALFHLARSKLGRDAALTVMMAASLLFYLPWGWLMLVLLVVSLSLNFTVGHQLLALPDGHRWRGRLFWLGQAYNLGALIWFKYKIITWFLARDSDLRLGLMDMAIPAGISFYTFHQAAFLADALNREPSVVAVMGHLKTLKQRLSAFVRYGAFVAFFPQLVIGPITYMREFQPQIDGRKFLKFSQMNLAVGLALVALGMFKKVVIADNLGPTVDVVFAAAHAGAPINPVHAWAGALSYVGQLYFDFSGYSDMALGLARMFGIRYPINFFSPLKAVGIIDYYKRWHMTLTRVISRFLYTPLSLEGTRYAARRRLPWVPTHALAVWLPLMVNFEVIALWHGALWTFIVFGLMHGTWYVIETEVRATKRFKKWKKNSSPVLRAWIGRSIFILPMVISYVMFRSESLSGAMHLYAQMFGANIDAPASFGMARPTLMLAIAFAIIYLAPNTIELLRRYRPGIMTYENESYSARWAKWSWRPNWLWAAFCGVLTIVALYYVSRQPPFLYQGF